MSEYSITQIDNDHVVLSRGEPQLKFSSRSRAEDAIEEVARFALRPTLHGP
jgi:hypothetical protein